MLVKRVTGGLFPTQHQTNADLPLNKTHKSQSKGCLTESNSKHQTQLKMMFLNYQLFLALMSNAILYWKGSELTQISNSSYESYQITSCLILKQLKCPCRQSDDQVYV